MHESSAAVRPYIPYAFEDYRFKPGEVAGAGGEIWVADRFLPVMVHIDRRSGRVSGPIPLPDPGGKADIEGLEVHEGWVVARREESLTFVGAEQTLTLGLPGFRLAAGAEGIWTIVDGATAVRLDHDGVREEVELPVMPRFLAVGGGSVWAAASREAAWDSTTIVQIDCARGQIDNVVELDGAPYGLIWDGARAWVNTRVKAPGADLTSRVTGLDGRTVEVVAAFEREPTMRRFGPIIEGELWVDDSVRPFVPPEAGPSRIRRVSLEDGTTRAVVERAAPVAAWTLIEGVAWAPADRWEGSEVVEIDPITGRSRSFDLAPVDIDDFLPPRPRAIEATAAEREARDRIAEAVLGKWESRDSQTGAVIERPFISGITFDSVELEGRFPDTEVVIRFRSDEHPGVAFGRRTRVWEDDGAVSGRTDVAEFNLMEDIEACGYGLPSDPPTDRIVWF